MRRETVEKKNPKNSSSAAFKAGAISLAFMIIGYQAAIFVHRAAQLRIEAGRDNPDTVYVVDAAMAARLLGTQPPSGSVAGQARTTDGDRQATGTGGAEPIPAGPADADVMVHRDAGHSPMVEEVRKKTRRVESFRFNPNTASVTELQRLGLSEKQAYSIDSYRKKGGRFRRKEDFARSYAVPDSTYRRLEPYIFIPRLDINSADSAAFDALPGIGGYFASQMVRHREELGRYSSIEQLMEIRYFDREKLEAIEDLITCGDDGPG